jgi:Lamin Tail Domain
VIGAIDAVLVLGMNSEGGRGASFDALLASSEPPEPAQLGAALDRVTDGLWEIVGFASPRLLELIALHYVNEAKQLAEAIYEGVKVVVKAAQEALKWLGEEADALAQLVSELVKKIGALAAQIAGDVRALADHLRTLLHDVVDAIRAGGAELIGQLVAWMPEWAQDALLALYNALFDVVDWAVSAPFQILAAVAGWVEDVLTARIDTASNDEDEVHKEVKKRIFAASASDLNFELSLTVWDVKVFDLGTVTIAAGDVLNAVADVVLNDQTYKQTVHSTAADADDLRGVRAQESTTRARWNEVLGEQEAHEVAGKLTTGSPLDVRFNAPTARSISAGRATVEIRIDGANSTFVESPLGIPPRVSVVLNGREVRYPATSWKADATGISLTARVVAVPEEPPMSPPNYVHAYQHASLTTPTTVVAQLLPDHGRIAFKSAKATRAAALGSVDAAPLVGGEKELTRLISGLRRQASQPLLESDVIVKGEGSVRAIPHPHERTAASESGSLLTALAEISTLGAGEFELLAPDEAVITEVLPNGEIVLAGRPGVNVVQVAVSDGKTTQAGNSVMFFVTIVDAVAPPIAIVELIHDPPGPDPQAERTVLRCNSDSTVDMTGWTLRDLARHVYRFPSVTLQPGDSLTVWTGQGSDDLPNLYWGRRAAVWNNTGDSAILSDERGQIIARFQYEGQR